MGSASKAPFDQFWVVYPRKVSKRTARVAFAAALKRGSFETIMRRLEYVMQHEWSGRSVEHIPYPATWIRSEDFDDEIEAQEDDIEPPPPLIRLINVNDPFYERAMMMRTVLMHELQIWEHCKATHSCEGMPRCARGECRYKESKRPIIPTIDELIGRMK